MTKSLASKKTADALIVIKGISGGKSGKDGVSRLIYERVRLAIVSALAVKESLSFSELKKLLDTSDGNLSVHARKLEDAGLIRCKKNFSQRMPRTQYNLTARGRKALEDYLGHMEKLLKSMQ